VVCPATRTAETDDESPGKEGMYDLETAAVDFFA
jgi:hypothetical protein